jgi:hypothetical protein
MSSAISGACDPPERSEDTVVRGGDPLEARQCTGWRRIELVSGVLNEREVERVAKQHEAQRCTGGGPAREIVEEADERRPSQYGSWWLAVRCRCEMAITRRGWGGTACCIASNP